MYLGPPSRELHEITGENVPFAWWILSPSSVLSKLVADSWHLRNCLISFKLRYERYDIPGNRGIITVFSLFLVGTKPVRGREGKPVRPDGAPTPVSFAAPALRISRTRISL